MIGSVALRSKWVAVGATLAFIVGAGGVLTSSAEVPATASSFVPITPCRLADTRPAPDGVGTRATAVGSGDTFVAQVTGANGKCVIPASATGVSMNVAIVSPSAASFLTVFPSDQPRPLAASLNWVANQAPTPNAVTATLSPDGKVSFYNLAGSVSITADIVGYYEQSGSGAQGPAGPPGSSLLGAACTVGGVSGVVAFNADNGQLQCTGGTMGNKVRELQEQCDDGNAVAGDGCDSAGRIEPPKRVGTSGSIGNVTVTPTAWIFIGPTETFTARVGRTLAGSGVASLGLSAGTALIDVSFCYQIGGAGPMVVFNGNFYTSFKLTGTQQSVAAAAQSAAIPTQPSGSAFVSVKVGMCISASVNPAGTVTLNYNDYSSFWVTESSS